MCQAPGQCHMAPKRRYKNKLRDDVGMYEAKDDVMYLPNLLDSSIDIAPADFDNNIIFYIIVLS